MWDGYRQACVPPDAQQVQLKETRQAFYGGLLSMYELVNGHLAHLDEGDAMRFLTTLYDELREEGEKLDQRYGFR